MATPISGPSQSAIREAALQTIRRNDEAASAERAVEKKVAEKDLHAEPPSGDQNEPGQLVDVRA